MNPNFISSPWQSRPRLFLGCHVRPSSGPTRGVAAQSPAARASSDRCPETPTGDQLPLRGPICAARSRAGPGRGRPVQLWIGVENGTPVDFCQAIDHASNPYRGSGPDRRPWGPLVAILLKDYRWLPRSERGLDLGADPQSAGFAWSVRVQRLSNKAFTPWSLSHDSLANLHPSVAGGALSIPRHVGVSVDRVAHGGETHRCYRSGVAACPCRTFSKSSSLGTMGDRHPQRSRFCSQRRLARSAMVRLNERGCHDNCYLRRVRCGPRDCSDLTI